MPETTDNGCDAGELQAQAGKLGELMDAAELWAPVLAEVIADLDSIFVRGEYASNDEQNIATIAIGFLQGAIAYGGKQHKALGLARDALLQRGISREPSNAD